MHDLPTPKEMLRSAVRKLRAEAVAGLKLCGYSDKRIAELSRGIGPGPTSRVSEHDWKGARARIERDAFGLHQVLVHLFQFDAAWKRRDYASAVLCFNLAATDSYRRLATENRIPNFWRGERRRREWRARMVAAAETYVRLTAEGSQPQKLGDIMSALPWPCGQKDYKTFQRHVKKLGGMHALPNVLTHPS